MADDTGKASLSWQTVGNWTFAALIATLLYVWNDTKADLKAEQDTNAGQASKINRLEVQLEERRTAQLAANDRIDKQLDDMNRKIDRLLER